MHKLRVAGVTLLFLCCNLHANINPTCPPIDTPGGTLSYATVSDAYNPIDCMDTEWWYFVGNLTDQKQQQHSLQLNLFRKSFNTLSVGAGTLGFTFKHNNQDTYLWTAYPDNLLSSPGTFNAADAQRNDYHIKVDGPTIHYNFRHDPNDNQHRIGQVGARYTLSANGLGHIGTSRLSPNNGQAIHYQFHATLIDQRGMMPEGHNGFIGTASAPASWEWAAPAMTTSSWSINIFDQTNNQLIYQSGNTKAKHNRIWLDRQSLYHVDRTNKIRNTTQAIKASLQKSSQLYLGTWMSFCLDEKPYKSLCGVAVAFWQPGTQTASMDSDRDAKNGFIDTYLPASNTELGNTLTAFLAGKDNKKPKRRSYHITNDASSVFVSSLSHRHFSKRVILTIDNKKLIGAAIQAHYHQPTNQAIVLKFEALSLHTENVMFDPQNAFYEGAANVYLCKSAQGLCSTNPIGTGFIEQMGYPK